MNDTTTMTRSEAAAVIDPRWVDVVIARTARKPRTCICQRPVRSYTIKTVYAAPLPLTHVTESEGIAFSPEAADRKAARKRAQFPDATVTIEPVPNRNYRPDCLGAIKPRDVYFDYVGDAAFAQSGMPYCLPCGTAV